MRNEIPTKNYFKKLDVYFSFFSRKRVKKFKEESRLYFRKNL